MNVFAVAPIISIVVNVALGAYVIYRDPHSPVNRLFLGITTTLMLWSVGELLMRITYDRTVVWLGSRIGSLGWCLVGAFTLHLAFAITGFGPRKLRRWLLAASYSLGFLFIVMTWATDLIFKGFTPDRMGNAEIPGILRWPSKLMVAGLVTAAVAVLCQYYLKSTDEERRAWAGLVIIAASIPLVTGVVTDIALPPLGINSPVSCISVSPIMVIIIAYAIVSHGFMTSITGSLGSAIIRSVNEAVLVINPSGTVETANPAAERLTGYRANELEGITLDDLLITGWENQMYSGVNRSLVGDEDWCLLTSRGGEVVPVTSSAEEVADRSGKTIGSVVVLRDMRPAFRLLEAERAAKAAEERAKAEHKRSRVLLKAKQELEELSEFLESVIENIAEPLFIKDRDLTYIYCNRALRELTGLSKDEVLGKTDYDLFPREVAEAYRSADLEVFRTESIVDVGEEEALTADGVRAAVRTLKAPLNDSLGEVRFVVGVVSDITQQKQLEKARLDFIRIAAHELRTPLTSLKLGFEMLAKETRGRLDDDQQRSLEILSLSIERLSRLAKNLLDLASIEAGLMSLYKRPFQLEPVLGEALQVFDGALRKKGIGFSLEVEEELPEAMADPGRISQVLFNLISNAVKFTTEGSVVVSARCSTDGFIEVCVSDTGIGIPAADMESIFSRFAKVEHAEKAGEGTGLGLSITKAIVESHRGSVWVESAVGTGSSFYFTVPTA